MGDILNCQAGVKRNNCIEKMARNNQFIGDPQHRTEDLRKDIWIWALTNRLKDVLCRCDHRVLRYMAGIRWQDGRSSIEVDEMWS